MELTLLRELINKSIVGPDCEIDAKYIGLDMAGTPLVSASGNFVIKSIVDDGDKIVLFVSDTIAGGNRRIAHGAVERIEGMLPSRLAETYGITTTGQTIEEKSRRGRKPRQIINNDDDDEYIEGDDIIID